MPECLALASELFEQLGEVAMRLKRERVTLERTRETLHGIVELFTFAVRQPEPQMNFRVGGHKYGRAKQLANRTREVPPRSSSEAIRICRSKLRGSLPSRSPYKVSARKGSLSTRR